MKKIVSVFLILIFTLSLSACTSVKTDISSYNNDVEKYYASNFMPELSQLEEYQDINYTLVKDDGIFPWYALKLIVKYDESNFAKEKENLDTAYTYLEEPQVADYDDKLILIPMVEFEAKSYNFKVVQFDDTIYPKNFGMVGTNDKAFEIVYLWLYDPDLDYICENNANEIKEMNEFLEYHFKFEQ